MTESLGAMLARLRIDRGYIQQQVADMLIEASGVRTEIKDGLAEVLRRLPG